MVRVFKVAACAISLWGLARAAEPRPNRSEWEAGQRDARAAMHDAAAKEKKMVAVNKALELMQSLQSKVIEEGEAEAKTYKKFSCFCKDTSSEKSEAIQRGTDERTSLVADIGELASTRDQLDSGIQETSQLLADLDKVMKSASHERLQTLRQYEVDAADLQAAVLALENAIKMLKNSETVALVQVSDFLRPTLALADSLGLVSSKDKKDLGLLQQEPENGNEVPMEHYDFHSDGITATLEKLLGDFRKEHVKLDEEEAKSVHEHDIFMQQSADQVKAHTQQLEAAKEKKAQTNAEIQESSQRLTTVEATLRDDKAYASKLSQMCSDKAKTWDQRSHVRANEITALTQAMSIIKGAVSNSTSAATMRFMQHSMSVRRAEAVASSPADMRAIELSVEEAPSFLQLRGTAAASARRLRGAGDGGRAVILDLLSMQGERLHSTLLTALAGKIAADPFAKIKTLIKELIERLQQEAATEANQKGWCDKAVADAEQKRDYASEEVRDLNSQMAKDQAVRDTLTEELAELSKAIGELTKNREEAQADRDEESAENTATVDEAQQGLDALNMCIDLLDQFYKTIKKESVNLSFVAAGPEDDAPDAGFDNGEAYTGSQSESGGILAMLDVMKSDFTRTISETKEAERQAAKDHEEFLTETGASLATKEEAKKAKLGQLDDTNSRLEETEIRLKAESEALQTALKELMELKPVCVDTGMSYGDRVAHREDEIAALTKASCILGRYAEYGPDAASEGC